MNQEFACGSIEKWTTDDVLAARHADQSALEQRVENGARIHAANVVDLRRGDGLTVGDDGKRLERGDRKAALAFSREIFFENVFVFRTRRQPPAPARMFQREAADIHVEKVLDLFELLRDCVGLFAERFCQRIERHRFVGHEQDCFQCGAELIHRWS